jgi:hypothetical protein
MPLDEALSCNNAGWHIHTCPIGQSDPLAWTRHSTVALDSPGPDFRVRPWNSRPAGSTVSTCSPPLCSGPQRRLCHHGEILVFFKNVWACISLRERNSLTTAPYQTAYNTKHIATKYNDAKSWLGRGGRGEKETGCNFYTRFSPQPYFGLSIRLSHFKTTL